MFTKMDLRWGYNNICIKKGDEWKAAFVCHHSAFEPLVMFFSLCNSPSTFQMIMNEIFADMEEVVVIYIDDIIIFTKMDDLKEHDKIVLEVLCHLEENDLYIKPEKYTFRTTEVDFLGMIVLHLAWVRTSVDLVGSRVLPVMKVQVVIERLST